MTASETRYETAAPMARTAKSKRSPFQAAHLFVLPYVVFLLAFGVGPGIYALLVSFSKTVGGRPQLFQAGLSNYVTAFTDFRFGSTIENMLQFLLIAIPMGIIGVLLLSLLLHERKNWFSTTMRTIYFVPGAVAGPALVLIAIFMFDPNVSPFDGLLRDVLGYEQVREIVRERNFPLLFAIIAFFGGAGGWIAIFYGALNGISNEIVEAAIIDGCNNLQLALRIKMPLIRPYIAYMLILTFAGNVQLFAEPQLIGRAPGSTVSAYWSPNQLGYAFAFELGNFGAAAALSMLLLVIGIVGAFIIIRATNLFRTEAGGD
ncbi:MAG: sugar ABC transporter permease [Chloroflexota bacterium]|nr:sugar ABC transporter permease [Chloroflexota bacterium]